MPFDQLDLHKISSVGENVINYSEFLAATIDVQLVLTDERLLHMYQEYADAEGLITKQSLQEAFERIAQPQTEEEITAIFESHHTKAFNFDQFK